MLNKSVLKWLLGGFLGGFLIMQACVPPPIQKQEPTPTAPCRLVPLIVGPCIDPKEA